MLRKLHLAGVILVLVGLVHLAQLGWELVLDVTHDLGRDPVGDRLYQSAVASPPDRSEYPADQHGFTDGAGIEFVLIPPGEFIMGSPSSEEYRQEEERPHRVRITRPFYLGAREVTVGQFRAFCEATGYRTDCEQSRRGGETWIPEQGSKRSPRYSWRNPGFPQTADHPVVNVSWNDAMRFCEWLGDREQCTYRLPTEAEWEYACRAGTTTLYGFGTMDRLQFAGANLRDTQECVPHRLPWADGFAYTAPVGSFSANALGLFDMPGNVSEWCADWYGPDYYRHSPRQDPKGPEAGCERVRRDSSFLDATQLARPAHRSSVSADYGGCDCGFRVARDCP